MKMSKGMFVLLAGFAMSGAASAQDQAAVSAEKTAPLKTLIPGAYGKVEVRHDTIRSYDGEDKVLSTQPQVNIRPTLGLTMFNDKVDSSFTYVFAHNTGDNTVKKSDVYNETQWNVVEGKFNEKSPYNFGPYAFTDFWGTNNGSFWYSDVGVYGEANYELPIPTGALAFQVYVNPMGEFIGNQHGKDNPVKVENRTNKGADQLGLTLDDDKDATIRQRDPSIVAYSGVGMKYKPEKVAGLSIGLGLDLNQSWQPVYVAKTTDTGATRTELDHYSAQAFFMNRLIIAYKFNDKVSLTNQLRQFVGGYEQRGIDSEHPDKTVESMGVGPYRYENRLSLTATLF